jgi:predicted amidophosphoribosyltransferase
VWGALADLLLPVACAGCGAQDERLAFDVCGDCVRELDALRAGPTRPDPAPPGLPPCFALGDYGGPLRELIIGFKDRGRYRLAHPLGALLAEAVASAVPPGEPVVMAYVPDSAGAARDRHGDHMRALARRAAARLRREGRPAVAVNLLKVRSLADSARLDARQRAEAAAAKFTVRRAFTGEVILVDDVITTGSTLAAASTTLAETGVGVRGCVALAATQRRISGRYYHRVPA